MTLRDSGHRWIPGGVIRFDHEADRWIVTRIHNGGRTVWEFPTRDQAVDQMNSA